MASNFLASASGYWCLRKVPFSAFSYIRQFRLVYIFYSTESRNWTICWCRWDFALANLNLKLRYVAKNLSRFSYFSKYYSFYPVRHQAGGVAAGDLRNNRERVPTVHARAERFLSSQLKVGQLIFARTVQLLFKMCTRVAIKSRGGCTRIRMIGVSKQLLRETGEQNTNFLQKNCKKMRDRILRNR